MDKADGFHEVDANVMTPELKDPFQDDISAVFDTTQAISKFFCDSVIFVNQSVRLSWC